MLDLIKMSLRLEVDYKHEDELLEHYEATSKEYILNATGAEFNKEISIHRQIVLVLVNSFYENRNTSISAEFDRTLTSMLLQAGLINE